MSGGPNRDQPGQIGPNRDSHAGNYGPSAWWQRDACTQGYGYTSDVLRNGHPKMASSYSNNFPGVRIPVKGAWVPSQGRDPHDHVTMELPGMEAHVKPFVDFVNAYKLSLALKHPLVKAARIAHREGDERSAWKLLMEWGEVAA